MTDITPPRAALAVTLGERTYMVEERFVVAIRTGVAITEDGDEFFVVGDDALGQFLLTHYQSVRWLIMKVRLERKSSETLGRKLMAHDLRRLLAEGDVP